MKHQYFFTICLFLIISTLSYAQESFKIGGKAGANFAGFHTSNGANTDVIDLHLGAVVDIKLNKTFGAHGELLYSRKGGDMAFNVNNSYDFISFNIGYLEVPVQAKVYVTKWLSLNAGAYVAFKLHSNEEYRNNGQQIDVEIWKDELNSFDFGLNGGLEFNLTEKMSIETRYNYGLTKLIDDFKYKNSSASLSFIYFFK